MSSTHNKYAEEYQHMAPLLGEYGAVLRIADAYSVTPRWVLTQLTQADTTVCTDERLTPA